MDTNQPGDLAASQKDHLSIWFLDKLSDSIILQSKAAIDISENVPHLSQNYHHHIWSMGMIMSYLYHISCQQMMDDISTVVGIHKDDIIFHSNHSENGCLSKHDMLPYRHYHPEKSHSWSMKHVSWWVYSSSYSFQAITEIRKERTSIATAWPLLRYYLWSLNHYAMILPSN